MENITYHPHLNRGVNAPSIFESTDSVLAISVPNLLQNINYSSLTTEDPISFGMIVGE